MARQLRIEYEGAFYHITSRGNQREKIFWDDKDREEFKKILKRTKERYGYLLHAYVLMDNHYHLLIETPHANIKQAMQNINTSYTVYVNRRHERFGHLLQGRYKAFIVDKENYLLELGRYIHLNPVRAKIVKRPEDYKWSSYREYLQGGWKQTMTDTDDTLYSFSTKRAIAVKKYQEFMSEEISEVSPLKGSVGSVLGDETFREKVIRHLKGIPDKTEIPEVKEMETKYLIKDVIKAVSKYYGVREEELLKRKKATERQRKIAIYLCKTLSGKKNIEVGRTFGITLQAVTNAVRDIERMGEEDKKIKKEIEAIRKKMGE
jgi:REP element-mobilizing transposase RayT